MPPITACPTAGVNGAIPNSRMQARLRWWHRFDGLPREGGSCSEPVIRFGPLEVCSAYWRVLPLYVPYLHDRLIDPCRPMLRLRRGDRGGHRLLPLASRPPAVASADPLDGLREAPEAGSAFNGRPAPKESVDCWLLAIVIEDAIGGTSVCRYPSPRGVTVDGEPPSETGMPEFGQRWPLLRRTPA